MLHDGCLPYRTHPRITNSIQKITLNLIEQEGRRSPKYTRFTYLLSILQEPQQ